MIKLAFFSDTHGDTKTPKNRKDDYWQAFQDKFSEFIDYCLDEKVDYIGHAGDIVESHKVRNKVTAFLLRQMRRWEYYAGPNKFMVISGQHDSRYHGSIDDTPHDVILSSGLAIPLGAEPFVIVDRFCDDSPDLHIYGCSFGEPIPAVQRKDATNILMIHAMISKEPPWPGATPEDYISAQAMLKSSEFDFIVAGDNHKPFVHTYRSKKLVMCGSMMRKNMDQADYQPKFYLYYHPNNELESKNFLVHPDVFREEAVELSKERKDIVNKFAESLKGSKTVGLKFVDRVKLSLGSANFEDHVKYTIDTILEEVGNG